MVSKFICTDISNRVGEIFYDQFASDKVRPWPSRTDRDRGTVSDRTVIEAECPNERLGRADAEEQRFFAGIDGQCFYQPKSDKTVFIVDCPFECLMEIFGTGGSCVCHRVGMGGSKIVGMFEVYGFGFEECRQPERYCPACTWVGP